MGTSVIKRKAGSNEHFARQNVCFQALNYCKNVFRLPDPAGTGELNKDTREYYLNQRIMSQFEPGMQHITQAIC